MSGRGFEGLSQQPAALEAFSLRRGRFNRDGRRRLTRACYRNTRAAFVSSRRRKCRPSKVLVWLLNELARGDSELASRIVDCVARRHGWSTNLGRLGSTGAGCFARAEKADLFRSEKDTFDLQLGTFRPGDSNIELGIRRDETCLS